MWLLWGMLGLLCMLRLLCRNSRLILLLLVLLLLLLLVVVVWCIEHLLSCRGRLPLLLWGRLLQLRSDSPTS